MIKQVIDFNRLSKQEYMKPTLKVVEVGVRQQILAGSLTSVQSTGLDEGEELKYGNDDNKSGSMWDNAW
ncbi:MAG: hypothetical protein IJP47_05300 [Prevotella sp.]|nr:hypothetical protein [Prevotella sp.]